MKFWQKLLKSNFKKIENKFNGVDLPEIYKLKLKDLFNSKKNWKPHYTEYEFYLEDIDYFHAQLPPGLVPEYYKWQSENCDFSK